MTDQHNLEVLIESHFPIVVLETHEEQRVVNLIGSSAESVGKLWFR